MMYPHLYIYEYSNNLILFMVVQIFEEFFPLYLGILLFLARDTEHIQACWLATVGELKDYWVSFMRYVSPFLSLYF